MVRLGDLHPSFAQFRAQLLLFHLVSIKRPPPEPQEQEPARNCEGLHIFFCQINLFTLLCGCKTCRDPIILMIFPVQGSVAIMNLQRFVQ